MTVAEYIRLVAQIAILKEIAEEYPGKTIFPEVQWSDNEPTNVKLVIEKDE